jgi:hypothetical protein
MSTMHFEETTTARPRSFSPDSPTSGRARSKLFGSSADKCSRRMTWAPVRPTPRRARAACWNACTTTGPIPHVWRGDSGHTFTLTPKPDGTTDIDAVVVREGKNLKGPLLGILGKRVLGGVLGSQPGSIAPSPRRAR